MTVQEGEKITRMWSGGWEGCTSGKEGSRGTQLGKQLAFVLREEGSLGFGVSAFLGEEQ